MMPDSEPILEGLAWLANRATLVSLLWHLIALSVLVCLYIGWRPSRRNAALGMCVPLVSVSALAWLAGLPFNAAVVAGLALALGGLALRLSAELPALGGPAWARVAGGLLIALGWLYPHFLETEMMLAYAVAAPLGVVPCATLAMLVGFALAGDGLGSRAWSLTLAAAGAFYGVFGAFFLGIFTDLALLVGSVALGVHALTAVGRVSERKAARPPESRVIQPGGGAEPV